MIQTQMNSGIRVTVKMGFNKPSFVSDVLKAFDRSHKALEVEKSRKEKQHEPKKH